MTVGRGKRHSRERRVWKEDIMDPRLEGIWDRMEKEERRIQRQ